MKGRRGITRNSYCGVRDKMVLMTHNQTEDLTNPEIYGAASVKFLAGTCPGDAPQDLVPGNICI